MPNQLDFEVALHLAQALTTIGEKSKTYWTSGAIEETADDLVRWCKGAIVDGYVWGAEAQAKWLVTQAREQWDEWKGTRALRGMFDAKFKLKPPERREFNPNIGELVCDTCGDTGFQMIEKDGMEFSRPCPNCRHFARPGDPGNQKHRERNQKTSPAISDLAEKKTIH